MNEAVPAGCSMPLAGAAVQSGAAARGSETTPPGRGGSALPRPVPPRRRHFTHVVDPIPWLPDLRVLGRVGIRRADLLEIPPHSHANLELHYLVEGRLDWFAAGELCHLTAGSLFVTWPGEAHGSLTRQLQRCDLCWLQLALPVAGEPWLGLEAEVSASILEALHRPFGRCVRPAAGLAPLFDRLLDQVGAPVTPVSRLDATLAMQEILLEVARTSGATAGGARDSLSAQAVRVMSATVDRPLPLQEVADGMGVSVSHLKHRFALEMGVPPAEYHLSLRMREACTRLSRSDQTITMLAHDLGFASSQNFATSFKRMVGMTPRRYRAAAAAFADLPADAPLLLE